MFHSIQSLIENQVPATSKANIPTAANYGILQLGGSQFDSLLSTAHTDNVPNPPVLTEQQIQKWTTAAEETIETETVMEKQPPCLGTVLTAQQQMMPSPGPMVLSRQQQNNRGLNYDQILMLSCRH
jgi:hypothetical protein